MHFKSYSISGDEKNIGNTLFLATLKLLANIFIHPLIANKICLCNSAKSIDTCNFDLPLFASSGKYDVANVICSYYPHFPVYSQEILILTSIPLDKTSLN